VAVNDAYTSQWNTTLVTIAPGVKANDTDLDNDSLTATKVTSPSHGTVTLNGNGGFNYLPFANYSGQDSFTYKVSDGIVDSNAATVVITITSPCRAPQTHTHHYKGDGDDHDKGRNGHHKGDRCEHDRDENGHQQQNDRGDNDEDDHNSPSCAPGTPKTAPDGYTAKKSTPLSVTVAKGVRKNDGSMPTTVELVTVPVHGSVTLAPNGAFLYTPTVGFVGTDTFYYVARSASGVASHTEKVTIRVTATGNWDDDDRCENAKHDHDRDNDWKHKTSKYKTKHKDDGNDDDDDERCENSKHDHRRDGDWFHRNR
jgi:hypothetical protein